MLGVLVVLLHFQSIASVPWSPLDTLKTQLSVYESDEDLYGRRPGSVFLIESNPVKQACNNMVLYTYLTLTRQSNLLEELGQKRAEVA